MIIKVEKKEEFSSLLKKKKGEKKLYEKLWNYKDVDNNLPSNFPKTALKNDLQNSDGIRIELLTGIIYLMLKDNNPDEVGFKYTVQDFQKIFTHFNKSDLNTIRGDYFEKYNHLLEKLTANHPFGKLTLNDNWEIIGGKSTSIEDYNNRIDKNKNEKLNKKTFNKNILVFIGLSIIISALIFYISISKNNSIKRTETQDTKFKSKNNDSVMIDNELIKTKINIKSSDSIRDSKININIYNSDSAKIHQINNFNNVKEVNL